MKISDHFCVIVIVNILLFLAHNKNIFRMEVVIFKNHPERMEGPFLMALLNIHYLSYIFTKTTLVWSRNLGTSL